MQSNRLLYYYNSVVRRDLMLKYNYTNFHQIAKVDKIICNFGFKKAIHNKYILGQGLIALELITGQRAKITNSKKNIISLGVRQGFPIGCKVTLKKEKCYLFLDFLTALVLPRVKYLKPFLCFDGQGNCTFTITDPISFFVLEEEYSKFKSLPSLNITIITTAGNDIEGKALLSNLQLPVYGHKI